MSAVIDKFDIDAFDGDGLIIEGSEGADFIIGSGQDDLIIGNDGDDTIRGGRGDDLIQGGAGDDLIFGQFGDDCIHGGEGHDTIKGGRGDDIIDGGAGSDLLYGGKGADIFEFDLADFAEGDVDTIADFDFDEDAILITGVSDDVEVTIDAETNSILVDGETIINVDSSSSGSMTMHENEDGDYEII